jgi:nucleoside-diphosphate-sugar epimerase
MNMKVLFIGGTGIISSAVSELLVNRGIELFHLTRGLSHRKIKGVQNLTADISDLNSVQQILGSMEFDAVVDWICFTPDQAERDIRLFSDKTDQFVFISSASVYQTPPEKLPVTEKTILENPFWKYSREKIECEKVFMRAFEKQSFPTTIVRPSHTYDKTLWPLSGGYTVVDRIIKGQEVIIHGDGTSIWTLTNHKDFALGIAGLLGNKKAIGEDFHITSDELLTWNQIFENVSQAVNGKLRPMHIASDYIGSYDADLYGSLLGDKAHSMIFDNSKIKSFVPEFQANIPFKEGIKEVAAWYKENPDRQIINQQFNELLDKIIKEYKRK